MSLSDLESRATHEASFPVGALEGWGVDAQWRGLSLLEVVEEAGGNAESRVRVTSLEVASLGRSQVFGPQLAVALLATHLNGERLPLDHGYPLRLIAPNRAEVLNTKWLTKIEVL